jgi:hypothetical protein
VFGFNGLLKDRSGVLTKEDNNFIGIDTESTDELGPVVLFGIVDPVDNYVIFS